VPEGLVEVVLTMSADRVHVPQVTRSDIQSQLTVKGCVSTAVVTG
jgi:hypothetical protein